MKFQQIRGATSIVEYGGSRFLIDPFFADKDSLPPLEDSLHPCLRWPTAVLPLSPEKIILGVDAVIVTHLHPDHFDEAAAKTLDKKLKLFAQDEYDAERIHAIGFADVEIVADGGTHFRDSMLYKTNCIHGRPETTNASYERFGMRGKACGVVFKADDEPVFYLAGDTIWTDCVNDAIAKYSPEVITLNAAGAQFRNSGLIIMGTEDVAKVRQIATSAKIIISHMDAVPHASVSRADMKKFIAENSLKDIFVPDDGETLVL